MTVRRVVCKEFGAGELIRTGYFGKLHTAFVKFDGSSLDGTFVLVEDLGPEIINEGNPDIKTKNKDKGENMSKIDDVVNDTERKLESAKELESIQADALAEAKEIEDMDNITLVDEFERLIRNGAGHGYRRVVFMKKEMLKRMNRGDIL
jgi:hypothetical protein